MERISSRFNNPESDITCRSSDFISFKLKRVNLQMFSNILILFADTLDANAPNRGTSLSGAGFRQRPSQLDACGESRITDAEGTKGKGLGVDDEPGGDLESRDDRGSVKGGNGEFFSVEGDRNAPSPSPSSASTSTLTPYGRAPPSPTPSPPPLNRTETTASNTPAPPPTIELTESSATLEILFQFMHNQPQPIATIATLSFNSLVALVSAVEKYQVHAAKEACRNRLRECIPRQPLKVLHIATIHRYTSLMDEAAPYTLGLPLKDIQSTLTANMFIAWVHYHHSFSLLLHQIQTYQSPTRYHWESLKDKPGVKTMDSPCEVWTELYAKVVWRIGGWVGGIVGLNDSTSDNDNNNINANGNTGGGIKEIFRQTREVIGLRCMSCPKWMVDWEEEVLYRMGKMKKFTFHIQRIGRNAELLIMRTTTL
ncbi:hypothetical protein AB1N83_006141 [Pleurotus pulmonarius]